MNFFSYSNQVVRGIIMTSLILLFGTIGYWLINVAFHIFIPVIKKKMVH